MRRVINLIGAALVAAAPAVADPNPQLTHSVANRLAFYGIRVAPDELTTAQAGALHLMLVSKRDRGKAYIRRRARHILTSPQFRD